MCEYEIDHTHSVIYASAWHHDWCSWQCGALTLSYYIPLKHMFLSIS